jgi:hypothetical protein
MKVDATQVLDAALHLPRPARAFLAEKLLAEKLLESLDAEPGFPLSEEWPNEISRRCEQIDRGEVELIPGDKIFEQAFRALG